MIVKANVCAADPQIVRCMPVGQPDRLPLTEQVINVSFAQSGTSYAAVTILTVY